MTTPGETTGTVARPLASLAAAAADRPAYLRTAVLVLAGAFLIGAGTNWDISWHVRVGRESFWIPPHLVIYGGALLVVASVAAGLWQAHGVALARGRPLRSTAPRGLWLSALGAAWFLASAPFDEVWHRLFGLDVTLWSPPHLSLIAAGWTIVLGAATLATEERARGVLVVALAFLLQPVLLVLAPGVRYSYLQPGLLGPWLLPTLVAALAPCTLVLVPTALHLPAGWSLAPLAQILLRPLSGAFTALGYALVLPAGLPATPAMPWLAPAYLARVFATVPLLVLVPALAADLAALALLGRGRAGGWPVGAATFGAVVAVEGLVGPRIVGQAPLDPTALVVALPVLALLSLGSAAAGQVLARATVARGEGGEWSDA